MATFRFIPPAPHRFSAVLGWATCMTMLSTLWLGSPAFARQVTNTPDSGYEFYYFKEARPLKLDVRRVAVWNASGGHATELDLSSYGLDGSAAEPMAVRGWSFVPATASVQTDTGIEGVVSRVAGDALIAFVSPVFLDDEGGPIVVTPKILVGFDRSLDPARAEAILADSQAGEIMDRDWANMQRTYRLKSSSQDGFEVLEAANRLAQRPEVVFAEPDLMVTGRLDLIPNDTYFPYMWALHNDGTFPSSCVVADFDMDAPEAWDVTIGDPSILVAVLDSGVQLDHPDLNLYTPGFDATGQGGGGGPVNRCDNHGTWVAGCISGIINNGLGIVGIAPGVRVASARMFVTNVPQHPHDPCTVMGTVQASWVVDALAWAESIGARITNSSWTRGAVSGAIDAKYADTRANGMVHFAAAGNASMDSIGYPASLPSVNALAALDLCGNRAAFSNYGDGLALSAPGLTISTDRTGPDGGNDGVDDGVCVPGETIACSSDADCGPGSTCFLVSVDYDLVLGTSFASPYAAGVAALVLSVNPDLTADTVESVLRQSAVDLGPVGYDTEYGWGFVNALQAVVEALDVPDEGRSFAPAGFALQSNRPNPFATETTIRYDLAHESTVQLRILDVAGRIVRATPVHSEASGPHEFRWNGTDGAGARMRPGMYFYELRVDGASQTRKAVLLQ